MSQTLQIGQASRDRPSQPSLWRLLRTTPLRDVVLGRLTGRLAIAHQVVEARLPQPLDALVLDVVRRTRLTRMEKAEVAKELIAHFIDGLDAGCSAQQLKDDFGEPSQSAALIRRSKKRTRPWPWRASVFALKAAFISIGAIVLLYAAMAARFYLGKPGPIIDYRPMLNSKAASLTEDQKAWPLYREALIALPKPRPSETLDANRFAREPVPGEEGWSEFEHYLLNASQALDIARQASSRDGMGLLVGYAFSEDDLRLYPEQREHPPGEMTDPSSDGMIGILLPHLSSLRMLALAIGWDVQRAAAAGDGATVLANIKAMLAIARHVRESSILISDLVGIAVLSKTCEHLEWLMLESPETLSEAQLAEIAHVLGGFNDDDVRVDLAGERLFFQDVLQRAYTDDGNGDGRLTPNGLRWFGMVTGFSDNGSDNVDMLEGLKGPAIAAVMLGRRDMHEQHKRLMDMLDVEAGTPLWKREHSEPERIIEEWMSSPIDRLRYLPLCLLMPALSKASLSAEMAMMRRDAVLVVLAAELHRRRHGEWPQSIDELVPSLLPQAPVDRFDGRALRYVLREGRPLVYSVGSNRVDDGGVLPTQGVQYDRLWYARRWLPASELHPDRVVTTTRPDGTTGPEYHGDFLLWPPLPRSPLLMPQAAADG